MSWDTELLYAVKSAVRDGKSFTELYNALKETYEIALEDQKKFFRYEVGEIEKGRQL